MATAYCPNCGSRLPAEGAALCPNCGRETGAAPAMVQVPPANLAYAPAANTYAQAPREIKNPGLAAILSLLVVGLGQVYNGEVGKGIAFFVVAILIGFSIFIVIGIILWPIWWIYCAYDAYKVAMAINSGARPA